METNCKTRRATSSPCSSSSSTAVVAAAAQKVVTKMIRNREITAVSFVTRNNLCDFSASARVRTIHVRVLSARSEMSAMINWPAMPDIIYLFHFEI